VLDQVISSTNSKLIGSGASWSPRLRQDPQPPGGEEARSSLPNDPLNVRYPGPLGVLGRRGGAGVNLAVLGRSYTSVADWPRGIRTTSNRYERARHHPGGRPAEPRTSLTAFSHAQPAEGVFARTQSARVT
jgi:hypothetical protein